MPGSTIIHASDAAPLHLLVAEGGESIDEFVHVELAVMLTLDFELLCRSAGVRWTHGDPLIFDEEAGVGVFGIRREGLEAVLSTSEALTSEQRTDVGALRAFVAEHGYEDLYEFATF